jgi:serine phosphatase RsbU (regulator of sigma subunit)
MSAGFLRATTRDAEHFRLTQELGFQSFMCVALDARGVILGCLTFISCDPHRRYGADDLDVAEELARRAAVRLDNTRLFTEERRARDEAEEARQRLAVLATAGRRLGESIDLTKTLSSVLDLAVEFYGEHAILYLGSDPANIQPVATAHRDPERGRLVEEVLRRYVPDPANPSSQIVEAVRTGVPVRIRPFSEQQMLDLGLPRDLVEESQSVQARSGVIVPLRGLRGTIGALSLTNSTDGLEMDEGDVEFAVEFADRVAMAIENATLYEDQRRVSHVLQQGLLPNSLPDVPGHEVAGRYVAAGLGVEAGGDFYDVLRLEGDATLIMVGDVCGRGPEAASVMGKARATLRALARRIDSPAALLQEVNDILLSEPLDGRFVTAGIVRLEPGDPHCATIALAGHPRPVLISPQDGAVLVGEHGPLLGIFESVEFTETVVFMGPGSALVTFTDGIETRQVHAEDRALELLSERAGDTAAELAEAAASGALPGEDGPDDDVAVVAVRRLS